MLTDAEATLEAARISAEATRCAGWMGLVAGILALCGAIWVGKKQTKITELQTKISDRSLMLSLLDIRSETHNKIRNFFLYILHHAREPDSQTRDDFNYGRHRSKILFSDKINNEIKEMDDKCYQYFCLKGEMDDKYEATGNYGDGNSAKEFDFLTWLTKKLKEIDELFIDEIRIGS